MAEADVNQQFEAQPRVADRVVDADVHVNPPPSFWADYLSPRFRDEAPRVESDGEYDYIVFEGERRPSFTLLACDRLFEVNHHHHSGLNGSAE